MRLFVLARHVESAANTARVLSSDPARPAPLTRRGARQARRLGEQLSGVPIEVGVASRLARAQETMRLALLGRNLPTVIDPDLDEIRAGDFDGAPIDAYWTWNERHTSHDRLPNGESVDEALLRYAGALERLLGQDEVGPKAAATTAAPAFAGPNV
jgi:broad specificity phosphatase PhoE